MKRPLKPTLPYIKEVILNRDRVPSFEVYPYNLPPIHALSRIRLNKNVTFFIGENGSGKSTLLEAIAVAFGYNAEGGTKNFSFTTRASHSDLHEKITLVKGISRPKDGFFLRAESFFNVASNIEQLDRDGRGNRIIDSYGGISLHNQSHGESFMSLMIHRFGGNGVYILDEPEAALSPQRQLALLRRMNHLIKAHSQFIIATHSPIVMAYPGATIYQFTPAGIKPIAYKETEHYKVTRDFLRDPDGALEIILNQDTTNDQLSLPI